MESRAENGNKKESMVTTRWRLERILVGDITLAELREAKAQRLYDAIRETSLSVAAQRNALMQARAFGKWCVKRGWLSSNPFENIEGKGKVNKGKKQMRVDESRRLKDYCLQAWKENRDRGAIVVLLAGWRGLRASEIVGLVARDIDDDGRLIWVADKDGKTEASRRQIRLPEMLRAPLLLLAASLAPEDRLFLTDDGSPATRHWAAHHGRRILAAANVPPITLHGLRGLHATLKATTERAIADANLVELAREMGHTSTRMTIDHYIDRDVLDDAEMAAIDDEIATHERGTNRFEKFPTGLESIDSE